VRGVKAQDFESLRLKRVVDILRVKGQFTQTGLDEIRQAGMNSERETTPQSGIVLPYKKNRLRGTEKHKIKKKCI
jgi:hypothetical protein